MEYFEKTYEKSSNDDWKYHVVTIVKTFERLSSRDMMREGWPTCYEISTIFVSEDHNNLESLIQHWVGKEPWIAESINTLYNNIQRSDTLDIVDDKVVYYDNFGDSVSEQDVILCAVVKKIKFLENALGALPDGIDYHSAKSHFENSQ